MAARACLPPRERLSTARAAAARHGFGAGPGALPALPADEVRVRICVVGAGSIGSLFAAHLATVADVLVLTRRDDHARALNEHGLQVTGRHDFTARVTAAADPGDLPEFDLGIVATKANGVEQAADSLGGRFPAATIMTVQNGLGAEEIVRAHGDWPLISGVTFMSGTKHSDTHVEYILDTPTWIGPFGETPFQRVQEVAELLVDSGLKAEALPDLRPAQWSKLIFNATVNGVAALTGLPHNAHFAAEGEVSDLGRPRATSDASELPECDFGIVATKAMHTSSAIATTAHAFAGGCVATVQNGLGNEEAIAEHVERVIRGTTFPAGKIVAPGQVQWDVKGDTTFGPFESRPAPAGRVVRLGEACTRAGMPTKAVTDARGPQWRKVIFNGSTNPIGALTGLTHGRVCEDSALRSLVSALVDEGKAVAAAQGIELDADPEELIDHAARPDVAYDHKASMLQDVEARRSTEIDYLNGGIVRFGDEHGVPTPHNRAIWALVRGLERSW